MAIADPAAPAAAPADPEINQNNARFVSSPARAPRSSGVTASLNAFGLRVQAHLARLADRGGDIAMEQPVDMNGHTITNVADATQVLSLVSLEQAREELDV